MVILDEGLPGWHAKNYPTEVTASRGKSG